MAEAAALVAGRHHFTAFTPTETKHVFFDRTVLRCRWTRAGGAALPGPVLGGRHQVAPVAARRAAAGRAQGMLCLQIEADAFLRHMVRTLVGTMIEVARGEASLDDFRSLLDGAPRQRGGLTAPPHGLFLWDIKYGRGGGRTRPRRHFGGPCGTIPEDAAGDGGAD